MLSDRAMREDDMSQGSGEGNADEEEEEEASPFQITVGLGRDLIEIPAIMSSGYHDSSGSVLITATSSVVAAIVVCLAFAFVW